MLLVRRGYSAQKAQEGLTSITPFSQYFSPQLLSALIQDIFSTHKDDGAHPPASPWVSAASLYQRQWTQLPPLQPPPRIGVSSIPCLTHHNSHPHGSGHATGICHVLPTSYKQAALILFPFCYWCQGTKPMPQLAAGRLSCLFFFFSRHEFPPCLENFFARALTKTSCVWILTLAKASAKSALYGTQSHKRKVQSRRVHFSFQESNRNSNYFSESRSALQIWYPLQSIHRIQGLLRLYFLNWC